MVSRLDPLVAARLRCELLFKPVVRSVGLWATPRCGIPVIRGLGAAYRWNSDRNLTAKSAKTRHRSSLIPLRSSRLRGEAFALCTDDPLRSLSVARAAH